MQGGSVLLAGVVKLAGRVANCWVQACPAQQRHSRVIHKNGTALVTSSSAYAPGQALLPHYWVVLLHWSDEPVEMNFAMGGCKLSALFGPRADWTEARAHEFGQRARTANLGKSHGREHSPCFHLLIRAMSSALIHCGQSCFPINHHPPCSPSPRKRPWEDPRLCLEPG